MAKIKLLHITHEGNYSDAVTNIISVLNTIDRNKFEIYVASERGTFLEKVTVDLGIKYFPISITGYLRSRNLKELELLYYQEKFDIVHSHSTESGYYSRLLKKHNPSVHIVHTIHSSVDYSSLNFFRRTASISTEQYLVQFTDRTIFVSGSGIKYALINKIADADKSTLIYNAINVGRFTNLKKDGRFLLSHGLSENNFVIGNISRFESDNNQKLIIQAAYYLKKNFPDIRFILTGSGKLLRATQEYARETQLDDIIIFPGEVLRSEDYYPHFDIYIQPSVKDNISYTLLEAMASRVPIICSDLPANREIIKHNISALTINPNDMDDLFRKIQNLYLNPELRNKLANNAQIEVTQYDESEAISKLEAVYQEIMN